MARSNLSSDSVDTEFRSFRATKQTTSELSVGMGCQDCHAEVGPFRKCDDCLTRACSHCYILHKEATKCRVLKLIRQISLWNLSDAQKGLIIGKRTEWDNLAKSLKQKQIEEEFDIVIQMLQNEKQKVVENLSQTQKLAEENSTRLGDAANLSNLVCTMRRELLNADDAQAVSMETRLRELSETMANLSWKSAENVKASAVNMETVRQRLKKVKVVVQAGASSAGGGDQEEAVATSDTVAKVDAVAKRDVVAKRETVTKEDVVTKVDAVAEEDVVAKGATVAMDETVVEDDMVAKDNLARRKTAYVETKSSAPNHMTVTVSMHGLCDIMDVGKCSRTGHIFISGFTSDLWHEENIIAFLHYDQEMEFISAIRTDIQTQHLPFVSVDDDGSLIVTTPTRTKILIVNQSGELTSSIETGYPCSSCVRDKNDHFLVCHYEQNRVTILDSEGKLVKRIEQGLSAPLFLHFDEDWCLYVSDLSSVTVFDKVYDFVRKLEGAGKQQPRGVTSDRNHVFVADRKSGRVHVYTRGGRLVRRLGSASLHSPRGVALTDDGRLIVACSEMVALYPVDT